MVLQRIVPKFILFLVFLLVVSVATPGQPVLADNFGDYTYTNHGDGTATITDYNGTATDVNIPGTLNGLTVIGIGIDAFRSNALTSVTIPDGIRTIGPQAFIYNNLTSVTIPGSVTSIGDHAFRQSGLRSVTLSDGVTTIGAAAFSENDLSSVTIPGSVTTMGDQAFRENSLTSVTILDGVQTIGNYAFILNSVSSVTIPGSVTTIGDHAFRDNSLISVTIPDGVTTIGEGAFYNNILTSVTLPDSLTSIGNSAFMNNSLTSVTIPDSSITIGTGAFQANKLTSITIPDSIPEIGEYALSYNQLSSVMINGSDTIIREHAFEGNQLPPANLTIFSYDSSSAQDYAADNGHTFYAFTDLISLKLSAGSLDPAFASGTEEYTASVANSENTIEVTPTVEAGTSTVTVNGDTVVSGSASDPIALNVGANTITVQVTAQDSTTKTYTVEVTRAASSNANLSGLTLSAGSLDPVFASGTEEYTASVANSVNTIEITPTVEAGTSTVTVNGDTVVSGSASDPIALNVGANTITVQVTAQDSTTKTYTVEVTRAASSNANLSGLTLSAGSLDPVFASGTEEYTASVANSVNTIEITPTVEAGTSTVTVNGDTVVSGSASDPIALNVGANTITVQVTAQDSTTKTYTVEVTRAASSNANLSGLTLSAGSLDPVFASGTEEYTASVANSVNTIEITPTVEAGTSTVTVNGDTVVSGSASDPIALNVGANTITVEVTAQDSTTKTYTVEVTRASYYYSGDDYGYDHDNDNDNDEDNIPPKPVDTKYVMTLTTEENASHTYTFTFEQGDLLPDVIELDGGSLKPGESLDAWILTIPAQTMRALVAYNLEGTVRLLTPISAYDLPVSVLSGIDATDVTEVTLRIGRVDPTILHEMEQAAAAIDARLAAVPVETELAVITADGKRVVQRYAQYVSQTLALNDAGDPDQQTGVRYHLSERTYQFVPSRFEEEKATLHSRSGGIDTVLVHPKTFVDVDGTWSAEITKRLGSKLIVNGRDEAHFDPDTPVTRAEMTAMLVRSLGLQADKAERSHFSDVSPASWYSSVLATAVREGLVQGDGTGEFRPEEHISREETVIMIVSAMRYANIQSKPDVDVDLSFYQDSDEISSWAKNAIAEAVRTGLILGNKENQLMPKKNTSRAEAAAMIDRLLRTIGFID